MSRRSGKSKMKSVPGTVPGTWVEREMFQSNAYNSLSGFAPQLLIHILGKRMFGPGRVLTNGDKLVLTYAEAEKIGVSNGRLARAYDELLKAGFIEQLHQGGTCEHDRSRYRLTDLWKTWKPGSHFNERKREVVSRGYARPGSVYKIEKARA